MTNEMKTKGYHWQSKFDSVISDIGISGLSFLKDKYQKDLNEFRQANDLNDNDNITEYKQIQQRFKMINEELENRYNMLASSDLASKDVHFNENYDVIVREENREIKVYRPSLTKDGKIDIVELDEEDIRD